jgi:predicted Na+-dependent transporter
MPFTIYGLGLLLSKTSINKALIVGIIIMGSRSTTISSNAIMTKNAMGNEYAALLNAIIGNILGIFISPALIFYFMKNPAFNLSCMGYILYCFCNWFISKNTEKRSLFFDYY